MIEGKKGVRFEDLLWPVGVDFLPDSSCIGILDNIKGTLVITSHNNTYPGIGGSIETSIWSV